MPALSDAKVLARAREIMQRQGMQPATLPSPEAVRDFLTLRYAGLQHEEFHVTWLDTQHRVIAHEPMFRGTLNQTSVFPREVVKAALAHNAAACVLSHNHPSGVSEPSRADELITQTLKQALALVDVQVLDHFVVAGPKLTSFAERGLL
jgi:DNA repair protein RadC